MDNGMNRAKLASKTELIDQQLYHLKYWFSR